MKTKSDLEDIIRKFALFHSRMRRLDDILNGENNKNENEKQKEDWDNACRLISLHIIEEYITGLSFTTLSNDSFEILENVWGKDIKHLKAFIIWNDNNRPNNSEKKNYLDACKQIRELIINKKNDHSTNNHKITVCKYIENKYLDTDGKIKENKDTINLITRKAHQIFITSGNTDDKSNWFRAKLYVRFFYENIIPAIINNKKDNIINVLNALEFSKSPENSFYITNVFELAIAIYFLDKEIINEIIKDSELFGFNMVPINEWPEDRESVFHDKFCSDKKVKLITYKGMMRDEVKDSLKKKVHNTYHESEIEKLYQQSHLEPFEDMIL